MNILEVLEKYGLDLTKQGDLYVTFCPFHRDENRPNFTIYVKTNSYYCYTCSRGGDAIDFFARMENISRAQALQKLYSDLSYLIDKINKVAEEVPYNSILALQMSKKFRTHLYAYPSQLEKVKLVMKEFDNQLTRDLDKAAAIKIIDDITTQLNTLAASV